MSTQYGAASSSSTAAPVPSGAQYGETS